MSLAGIMIFALAAALAATMFAGCGKGSDDSTKDTKPQESQDVAATENIEETENEAETESQEPQPQYPEIVSDGKVKSYQSVVTVDDAAYELYTYLDDAAGNYADSINKVASALEGKADVYDMVIPLSSEITFPDNLRDEINSTNQHQAMQDIQAKMNDKVKSVDIYDALMQHRNEYIYFRTDHHWTSKGAYYAYRQFCEAKGIQGHELSDYHQEGFGSFLGSFYLDTDHNKSLRRDNVKAYFPVDHKKMTMTYHDQNGGKYKSSVIANGKKYSLQLKYCAFLAGDNPYTVIHNKKIKDGSGCVVVKESYGNAFVPYLADHYEKIYVIDYRYWKGSISSLAKQKKVQDVIFINNISMTRNAYLIGKISQIK